MFVMTAVQAPSGRRVRRVSLGRAAVILAVTTVVCVALGFASVYCEMAFFEALRLRRGDVGLGVGSALSRPLFPLLFPGLPAAAILVALLVAAQLVLERHRKRVASVVVAAVIAACACLVMVGLSIVGWDPDFWAFVEARPERLAGFGIFVLCALTAVGAAIAAVRAGELPAGKNLILVSVACLTGLLVADAWGGQLGASVAKGSAIKAGWFPFGVDVQPVCVRSRSSDGPADGVYLRLGTRGSQLVLLDPDGLAVKRVALDRVEQRPTTDDTDDCTDTAQLAPLDAGTAATHAWRFRPRLLFDAREPWRPLEIGGFLAERFPTPPGAHELCSRAGCDPVSDVADLRGSPGAKLDLHNGNGRAASPDLRCHVGRLLDCDRGGRTAIYYRAVRRPDGQVAIDYWWFLRFNHFPMRGPLKDSDATCGGRGVSEFNHEGDWEGITVVADPDARTPKKVMYSAHGHWFWYFTLAAEERRPRVYVACGSHANYPAACRSSCHQTRSGCRITICTQPVSGRAEAPFGGQVAWGRNSDRACREEPICLLPLPTGIAAPSAGRLAAAGNFTYWAGTWGREDNAPSSPGLQGHFLTPWRFLPTERTAFG